MPVPDPHTITVLVPTFNRSSLLTRAVESVLQEDRVPVVVRIFDNASTDDTAEVARELVARDSRVRYLRRDHNVGGIRNYQLAMATVDTAYFVPLADDDWLLPDFLNDAHLILATHPEVGAAVFMTEHRDEHGALLGIYPAARDQIRFGLVQPREHLTDWMSVSHYAWSSILWRRETLGSVGAPYLCTGMPSDVDFQAQVFSRWPVYLVDRPGAVYLSHAGQFSAGFDVTHVYSWAKVFSRLDRAVHRDDVFTPDEYRRLRRIMLERFSGMWRAAGSVRLPLRKRVAVAYWAAIRLDDWEAAMSVLGFERFRFLRPLGSVPRRVARRLAASTRRTRGERR